MDEYIRKLKLYAFVFLAFVLGGSLGWLLWR